MAMKEVVEYLYKSLPYQTFKQVYQRTIRSLFSETEIISALLDPECVLNENVALHDIVACQNSGELRLFGIDGDDILLLKEMTDLKRLLKNGILRFKYLKVVLLDEDTELLMKYSEFVHQLGSEGKSIDCLEKSDLVEVEWCLFGDLEILVQSLKRPKIVFNYTQYPGSNTEFIKRVWEELVIPNNNLYLNYLKIFTVGDVYLSNFEEAVEEHHWFLGFANDKVSVRATVFLEVSNETTKEQVRLAEAMVERIGYDKIQKLIIDSSSEKLGEVPFTVASKLVNLEVLQVKCPFTANFNTLGDLKNTKLQNVIFGYRTYSEEWLLHGIPQTASITLYNLELEELE